MTGLAGAHTSSYYRFLYSQFTCLFKYFILFLIATTLLLYYIVLATFNYFVRSQKQYCTVPSLSVTYFDLFEQ